MSLMVLSTNKNAGLVCNSICHFHPKICAESLSGPGHTNKIQNIKLFMTCQSMKYHLAVQVCLPLECAVLMQDN